MDSLVGGKEASVPKAVSAEVIPDISSLDTAPIDIKDPPTSQLQSPSNLEQKASQEIAETTCTDHIVQPIPVNTTFSEKTEEVPGESNLEVLFKKGMEVELLGLEQSEQDLVVRAGTLHGLPGDSCHGTKLLDGEASVCVTASYVNDYSIYERIHEDDPPPPVTCMGQCNGMFIMWRMAAMKIRPPPENTKVGGDVIPESPCKTGDGANTTDEGEKDKKLEGVRNGKTKARTKRKLTTVE